MTAILRALGVGPGDEVIIQAFTCVAVPEGVLACGATPVYADIEAEGYNAGVKELAERITGQTRAIVVQHTFGLPADIEAIMALADKHGIPVIEDCCHTLRGSVAGRPLGSFGVAAFYSFEWGKPLIAGVGGSAVPNIEQLTEKLKRDYSEYRSPSIARSARIELQYRAFTVLYRPRWYWAVRSAFRKMSRAGAAEGNFNTPQHGEIAEDFGMRMSGHLKRRAKRGASGLDRDARHRLTIEQAYRKALACTVAILPEVDDNAPLARLPIRAIDKAGTLALAESRGVELADWYSTAIHPLTKDQMPAVGYHPGSCPNAEKRATEVVSLPTHRGVDARFVEQAAELFDHPPRLHAAA